MLSSPHVTPRLRPLNYFRVAAAIFASRIIYGVFAPPFCFSNSFGGEKRTPRREFVFARQLNRVQSHRLILHECLLSSPSTTLLPPRLSCGSSQGGDTKGGRCETLREKRTWQKRLPFSTCGSEWLSEDG